MPTSKPKTPGKNRASGNYHHGDLRAALLVVAGEMLERGGPDKLSLRDVARKSGVSHNAPYRHFPTREALLAALAAEGFRSLGEATAKARSKTTATRRAIDSMGLAYVEFALANPARYRLMFSGAKSQSAELSDNARAAFNQLAGTADTRSGETPNLAAVRAWAFVHGIAHLLLDKQINPALLGEMTPLQFAALLLGKPSR